MCDIIILLLVVRQLWLKLCSYHQAEFWAAKNYIPQYIMNLHRLCGGKVESVESFPYIDDDVRFLCNSKLYGKILKLFQLLFHFTQYVVVA